MSTELATRSNGSAALQAAAALDVMTLGTVLAKSGYFKDVREQAQAVVKVLAGAEMGFKPIASMMGVHFFEGRPTIGANLIAAAIRGSRVYDYRIVTHTADLCEIAILRDGQEIGRSSFSREEAQAAALLNKDNWRKYPKSMLFARAISNAAKWHCPDIFGGVTVYTADEMGAETDDEGNPLRPPQAPTVTVFEGEIVNTETGEIADALPTEPLKRWTQKQINWLHAQLSDLTPKPKHDDVKAILRVGSIQEWPDLDEAVRVVRVAWIEQHPQPEAEHPVGSVEWLWGRWRSLVADAKRLRVKYEEPPEQADADKLGKYVGRLALLVAEAELAEMPF